jgi:hypothetical protein
MSPSTVQLGGGLIPLQWVRVDKGGVGMRVSNDSGGATSLTARLLKEWVELFQS